MRRVLVLALAACASGSLNQAFAAQFIPQSRLISVGPNPSCIIAADLNGDGLADLATCDVGEMTDPREEKPANDRVTILLSEGDMRFNPTKTKATSGFAPYALAVTNLDALAAPDLVAVSLLAARDDDVSFFRNMGEQPSGGYLFEEYHFSVPDEHLPYTQLRDGDGLPAFTKPGLTSLAVGRFDGDAFRDVVATGWASDVLVFIPGDPDEYLGAPRSIPCPGGPRAVSAADLDGDGDLDLAVALYSAHKVGVFYGDGEGGFEERERFFSRGYLPATMDIADINGDGYLDLITSHRHVDDSLVIFYGDEDGRYPVSQELRFGSDRRELEKGVRDVVAADFDGDGRPDLAAACTVSREVVAYLNRSDADSLPQAFERERYSLEDTGGAPRALAAGDIDGDETLDLAVALRERNAVAILLGTSP